MSADTSPGLGTRITPADRQPRSAVPPVAVPKERIWQKEQAVLQRYHEDQRALGILLSDEGISHREIDRRIKNALNTFTSSDRRDQIDLSQQVGKTVDKKLRGIFFPNLILLDDLLMEANEDPEVVRTEARSWRYLFDESPRRERVTHTLRLREEVGDRLVENFGAYLQSWKQFLLEGRESAGDVDKAIGVLRNKFSSASRRGQVGIARELRERISAGDSGRFSAFLDMYANLLSENGNHADGETLPSPEEWRQMYDSASGIKKATVTGRLQNKIWLLVKPKLPAPEPEST